MPATPMIAYANVAKRFGGGRVVAVDDVSLQVAATRSTGTVARNEIVEMFPPQRILLEREVHVCAQVVHPERAR